MGETANQGALWNQPRKTLLLVDASNVIYRAFHAAKAMGKELSAPDGTPTGALTMAANMVERARKEAKADAVAMVFESPTGTFRDKLLESYKAQRPASPDALKIQMRLAKKLFPAIGIPALHHEGFEADDVLCASAFKANDGHVDFEGWGVVMASSDKDLGQAVGEAARQLDLNGWKLIGAAEVKEKFGVEPGQVAEFLALMGDAIDNVPGVDKVGKKTAAQLLVKHGSIEKILEHLDELTPSVKAGFDKAREMLPLLAKLCHADRSASLGMTPQEIWKANRSVDWGAAIELLEPLAMGRLLEKARSEKAKVDQLMAMAPAARKPAP